MAITFDQLLDPYGDITPAMFPEDSTEQLQDRLNAYLARAYGLIATAATEVATVVSDSAAAAYVNYLANLAVYTRLSTQALEITIVDEGSRKRSQGQLEHFNAQAKRYLETYNALIPLPLTPQASQSQVVTATPNRFVY